MEKINNDLLSIAYDDNDKDYDSFVSFIEEHENRNKKMIAKEIITKGNDFISEMEMRKEIDEIYRNQLIPYIVKKSKYTSKYLQTLSYEDVKKIHDELKNKPNTFDKIIKFFGL
jgi:hypothetical protein